MSSNTTSGVPPAPVLKFPFKYPSAKAPPAALSDTPLTPAASTPTDVAMTIDDEKFVLGVENVLKLSREDRARLFVGPEVTVQCEYQDLCTVPLRLLLAVSKPARDRYLDPESGRKIERLGMSGTNNAAPLKYLFGWVKETAKKRKCFALPSIGMAKDLKVIMVAQHHGMDNYVRSLINRHWATLHNDQLTFDILWAIHNADPTHTFSFWTALVRRISNDKLDGTMPDTEDMKDWEMRLPQLAAAVDANYKPRAEKKAAWEARQAAKLAKQAYKST
ncbi:hypothetical protein P280DRAFT_473628 [Massarina eburnea CBS 473.64]|uniref:Uncharacterized protein n=1 Tax=Massarina eburnea CBS 473.64 TaxID=1395130 RepID=A0A6A6RKV2_9PLEO|nr:hypothetical protein P280DRAFT_473628 [Massarina eburnea CBS 473.64]